MNKPLVAEGGVMPNDLELLLKLQIIDYDLGELERSKEYLPDMMDNLRNEIEEAKSKLETCTTEFESKKVSVKTLELEIASKEAELQKYQQQMMSIKTNKEYDALVAQIDAIKQDISKQETEFLGTEERIAELEKEIAEYNEKSESAQDTNSKQLSILQNKIDSIGDTMAAKENERDRISKEIPRPTRSIYERVRKGKGGTAVVMVKKRACGSCHKALTPRKVQEIKKGDRIHTCENCGRLLFWDGEESN
ncbi:MAG: C4-type zinc ribbon domain-containing protein [candidate division Zixibacteria bacterium]|nr:C4-type zinc ribbon domain-containing protein [candidate division Zixibacteria bacterium]MDH3937816.1 C4-type zinc ribbon domain-containing protein [candidate division Zixibacteria bacterium]MDH4033117.1 C4-type zinc ribbon domain-containing protein [candidate division Zixibacteria bacterium]